MELGKGLTDEVVQRLTELDSLPLIGLGNSTSEGGEAEMQDAELKDEKREAFSPANLAREEATGDDADDGAVFEDEDPSLGEPGKTVRFE